MNGNANIITKNNENFSHFFQFDERRIVALASQINLNKLLSFFSFFKIQNCVPISPWNFCAPSEKLNSFA